MSRKKDFFLWKGKKKKKKKKEKKEQLSQPSSIGQKKPPSKRMLYFSRKGRLFSLLPGHSKKDDVLFWERGRATTFSGMNGTLSLRKKEMSIRMPFIYRKGEDL